MTNDMKYIAIILAGGRGRRMGSDTPKQYLELAGKPVIAYSLIAFEESMADEIYVVCDGSYEDMIKNIAKQYGISKLSGFAGSGPERVISVRNGVNAALAYRNSADYNDICLMIHDGARPFISTELIKACAERAAECGAAIPGLPLKDTIKEVSGDTVVETPDRSLFTAVQTPQCFMADILVLAYEAYESGKKPDFIPTDDASLVEMFTGVDVKVVPGDERNIKLTTPADMRVARMLVN